jgi:cysteine desulfuration protein SufE
MSMTIQESQDEIIADFELFGEDWDEKYSYIIDLGRKLPLLEAQYKIDDNLIRGCQSKVWMHPEYKDGRIFFTADSDATITKGLIAMVIGVLSGHTPKEITDADIFFIDAIGLRSHLASTRANGLLSMLKQIKLYALAFQAKSLQP